MKQGSSALQTNLFQWRVSQQKRSIHKGHVNKQIIERPRLRTV